MPKFSVLIPFLDERATLEPLYRRLTEHLTTLGPYELLFIDDGSRDGSSDVVRQLFARDAHVRLIQLRRNFGKSAALSTGFRHARGSIFITIDADLQDDPAEIPRLLDGLEHADLVVGWKQHRHDPWTKTFPSRVFNGFARMLFHLRLHDVNCGLKVMRREVAEATDLYGEMHRFLPVLAAQQGFVVTEAPVTHHAREHGQSKYGWKRFFKGLLDLLTVSFLGRFQHRPLHLFGGLGLLVGGLGVLFAVYLSVLHFLGESIGQRPLLLLAALCIITGLQFCFTGLLAELLVSRQSRREYPVKTVLDHDAD